MHLRFLPDVAYQQLEGALHRFIGQHVQEDVDYTMKHYGHRFDEYIR